MRMIEKLSILACELLKTGINKKEFIEYFEELVKDSKVKAIFKELKGADVDSIYNDFRVYDLTKKTIKNSELILNKKFNQLYSYNKLFINIKKIF